MKKRIFIFNFIFISFLSIFSIADADTGYIDKNAALNHAYICRNVDCSTHGVINFTLTKSSFMVDDVIGLTGTIWGNELGWITLNPFEQGVHFVDARTGVLTGYAWGSVSGWINFGVTGQQVKINPTTGAFEGYAWAGGPQGGWIKFDCTDPATCVVTTWRANKDQSPPLPSLLPLDVCPNLAGIQEVVPRGFYKEGESCFFTAAKKLENTNNLVVEKGTIWHQLSVGGSYIIKAIRNLIHSIYVGITTYFRSVFHSFTSFFGNLFRRK